MAKTGIDGGIPLTHYKQFLFWKYEPQIIEIPINTCGHQEIVRIEIYRDTKVNGRIQIGTATREETGVLNKET